MSDLLENVTKENMAKHEPPEIQYLKLKDRTLAYRHLQGASPTIVYVGGFLSSMNIHKAVIVEQFAKKRGLASVRYDQSSVGLSTGVKAEDATMETWTGDLVAILDNVAEGQPVLIVASSMGCIVSSYVAAVLRPEQVLGMILIGPARHLYENVEIGRQRATPEQRKQHDATLKSGGTITFQTPYGKGCYSQQHITHSKQYSVTPDQIQCTVKILHAWRDDEAEWTSSLQKLKKLSSAESDLIIRKRGNHRLMKPTDLTLLTYTLEGLLEDVAAAASTKMERKLDIERRSCHVSSI